MSSVPAVVAFLLGDEPGYACEVGANDGTSGSNTLMMEQMGWTVLCVEANPFCLDSGRTSRKLWRAVAAGNVDADMQEFSLFSAGTNMPGNSALGITSRYDLTEAPAATMTMSVPVRRLDRILEEAGFHRLDYLAMDVEGWEPEVLEGFTVERWKPRVIVREDWRDNYEPIPGYEKAHRIEYDNIYVRRGSV